MRSLVTILAGAGLIGGPVQAAMPPALRAMSEVTTFRPFEVTVTRVDVDRQADKVGLTLAYTVRNTSDQPAAGLELMICDPEGRSYPSAPSAAPETALAPGAQAERKMRFVLPAQFDQAHWLIAVGRADGPRIRLTAP
jgi:hypothetical protein